MYVNSSTATRSPADKTVKSLGRVRREVRGSALLSSALAAGAASEIPQQDALSCAPQGPTYPIK